MPMCSYDAEANACPSCGRRFGSVVAARQCITNGMPGTELAAILKNWLGIESTPQCQCMNMAKRMDALGPDWCESDDGMSEILGVMRNEHGNRWNAGTTVLPWSEMAAKQLVVMACRRARANSIS